MNRKRMILLSALALLALCALALTLRGPEGYSAAIVLGCSSGSYEQDADAGYLTVHLDGRAGREKARFKVADGKARQELQERDPSEIIGVQVMLEIPGSVVKERGLNRQTDAFALLYDTDAFDGYATVAAVYFE